jgi:acetate kinase
MNPLYLDVRTQEEYDEGHIPNAILLPESEISEKAETMLTDINKVIFVYCQKGVSSERAAKMLNKDIRDLKIITCHLGNGASVCAIKEGKCVDTSMGFTPLEGLVMGTRCGDIDPSIVEFIRKKESLPEGKVNEILNKASGILGISCLSSDFRDVIEAAEDGNEKALLALKVFYQKVKAYIGSYTAKMNGVDCIVFTAGVGGNAVEMREDLCNGLDNLGIKLDKEKNNVRGKETIISHDDSSVKIMLIPTNEEVMIARDTFEFCK